MKIPGAIKEIIAEQIVFDDKRTLPKVIESILERLSKLEGVPAEATIEGAEVISVSEEGSETNGI